MKKITTFLSHHSLSMGLVLMFLYTWPIDLANAGVLPFNVPFPIYITLGWGFILVSLLMTGLTLGRDAVFKLLNRCLQWRVHWKWYVAALGFMPAMYISGVFLYAAFIRVPPDFSRIMAYKLFGESAFLPAYIVPFFLFDLITNGEEMGWRGYVLPRLQARYNALTSTLILSVIWGFWHLPKFITHFEFAVFGWIMLHTLAFAVLLTWLYNSTNGNLLLVALCHAANNTAGIFVPVANTTSNENIGAYITFVLLELAAAIVITILTGPKRLSRTSVQLVQV